MHERRGITRRDLLRSSAATAGALVVAGSRLNLVWARETATLRIGLVGCGRQGLKTALNCRQAAPGVTVVALADAFEDRLTEARAAFGVRANRCFAGLQACGELMSLSDVDLVILATPPAFRPAQFAEAVKQGKHVCVEAPVAICPTGVKVVLDASEQARAKGLAVAVGTQRRHAPATVETLKRIRDGAIGDLVSAQCYLNVSTHAPVSKRRADEADVAWQLRNWQHFTWLSGDFIVARHVHNIDVVNWAFGAPPDLVHSLGGRQQHAGAEYGTVYDHFGTEFAYPGDVLTMSTCRQMAGTEERLGERVVGTKGVSDCCGNIEGENPWHYDGAMPAPGVQLQADLIRSIRDGEPLNEGPQGAEGTLSAVMARESAYSRQRFKRSWFIKKCTLDLLPSAELKLNDARPVAAAVPGKYELPGLHKAKKK